MMWVSIIQVAKIMEVNRANLAMEVALVGNLQEFLTLEEARTKLLDLESEKV